MITINIQHIECKIFAYLWIYISVYFICFRRFFDSNIDAKAFNGSMGLKVYFGLWRWIYSRQDLWFKIEFLCCFIFFFISKRLISILMFIVSSEKNLSFSEIQCCCSKCWCHFLIRHHKLLFYARQWILWIRKLLLVKIHFCTRQTFNFFALFFIGIGLISELISLTYYSFRWKANGSLSISVPISFIYFLHGTLTRCRELFTSNNYFLFLENKIHSVTRQRKIYSILLYFVSSILFFFFFSILELLMSFVNVLDSWKKNIRKWIKFKKIYFTT